jgi:hypothetical protein
MKRTATILGIVTALAVPSVAAAGNHHPAQAGKPLVAHKILVAHKVQIAKVHRAVAARVTLQRATNLRATNLSARTLGTKIVPLRGHLKTGRYALTTPQATGWSDGGMGESAPVYYINRGNVAF